VTQSSGSSNALVVCTANVCRSPVAERLLQRHLGAVISDFTVSSAGTHGGRNVVHPDTTAAALTAGVDLSDHRSRRVTRRLLDVEGNDLVIALAREHVYHLIATDEAVWPHTFTFVEIVRRSEELAARGATFDGFDGWVAALSGGRRSSDLLPGRSSDDIADPYGRSQRHQRRMVRQVEELSVRLADAASASLARHPGAAGSG
jgi:protein-tyrosine phosphatase